MIHDIEPNVFDNQFRPGETPDADSYMIITDGKTFLLKDDGSYPQFVECSVDKALYIFSVDDRKYFLAWGNSNVCTPQKVDRNRDVHSMWKTLAAACALHLFNWYNETKYCGKCGKEMHHSKTERAMECECGHIVYPRINPVVIVGVLNGDRLLTTRYSIGHSTYRGYALIAGFAEFGESLEQTVAREVLEETGIHVKNIRFYKSQPWPYSQSLISGFFCDLDGDDTLSIDEEELELAEWHTAEEIPPMNDTISITGEMIELFRKGGVHGE